MLIDHVVSSSYDVMDDIICGIVPMPSTIVSLCGVCVCVCCCLSNHLHIIRMCVVQLLLVSVVSLLFNVSVTWVEGCTHCMGISLLIMERKLERR